MRALSRSRFPLHFSEGYHPHPRISYAYAAPVGMESLGEYADIQADRIPEPASTVISRLNACLPEGLSVVALEELAPQAPSLPAAIEGFQFSCPLPPSWTSREMGDAEAGIASFLETASYPLSRTVKGKQTTRDIRPFVDVLRIDHGRGCLSMKLRFDSRGTVRPVDILTEILGLNPTDVAKMTIRKEETYFRGLPL
jgi:radical SAM-linked protein